MRNLQPPNTALLQRLGACRLSFTSTCTDLRTHFLATPGLREHLSIDLSALRRPHSLLRYIHRHAQARGLACLPAQCPGTLRACRPGVSGCALRSCAAPGALCPSSLHLTSPALPPPRALPPLLLPPGAAQRAPAAARALGGRPSGEPLQRLYGSCGAPAGGARPCAGHLHSAVQRAGGRGGGGGARWPACQCSGQRGSQRVG